MNLTTELNNKLSIQFKTDLQTGTLTNVKAYGRLFSPKVDVAKLFAAGFDPRVTRGASLRKSKSLKFDSSKIMAKLEVKDHDRFRLDDQELAFKIKDNGLGEAKLKTPKVPGVHHVGVLIEGVYHPQNHSNMDEQRSQPERFERVLTYTFAAGKN